jgi:hypothetical protein
MLPPVCAVAICNHFLLPADSERHDLCLPHAKVLCSFSNCFSPKASRASLHCFVHARFCIECKVTESSVHMNANGRCVNCYSECKLQQAILEFMCKKCKCTRCVPDNAVFNLRCVECGNEAYYGPVVDMCGFHKTKDEFWIASTSSARRCTFLC